MYRKFLLGSVGAIALTGPALAAEPLPPPPPPVFTWTGPYVGGQVGGAWGSGTFGDVAAFDPVTGAVFASGLGGGTPSGVIGGIHVGYQYQFNQWVVGIEGSVDGTSLHRNAVVAFPAAFGGSFLTVNTNLDVEGTIRGKIGFAWDRVLIYGTGGVAFGGFSTQLTDFSATAALAAFPIPANIGTNRTGWTAGAGLEYAITNNWWVFAEYRYTNLGSIDLTSAFWRTTFPASGFLSGRAQIRQNQVQAGFSYRFDLAPPPPVVAKY